MLQEMYGNGPKKRRIMEETQQLNTEFFADGAGNSPASIGVTSIRAGDRAVNFIAYNVGFRSVLYIK